MAEILPGNGLQTALASDLGAGATTLSIVGGDASKWPTGGEYRAVLCQDPASGPWELVRVTGGQGTANLTVTRAVEPYNGDQTARAWTAGATVAAVITKDGLGLAAGGITLPLTQNLTFSPDDTWNIGDGMGGLRPHVVQVGDRVDIGSITSLIGGMNLTVSGSGLQISGELIWNLDNTYDIGAAAASRPRTVYAATTFVVGEGQTTLYPASLYSTGNFSLGVAGAANVVSFTQGGFTRWQIAANGHWIAGSDAAYDIGAAGATRPRDMYLGGNANIGGRVGIAANASSNSGLYISPANLTGSTQYGINLTVTGTAGATSAVTGIVLSAGSPAATMTMATARGIYILAPTVGAGSAITTVRGIEVVNQGATGITNAYGVYIAAQSGAATTNIGLYNAGTTRLDGSVCVGANPTAGYGLSVVGTWTGNPLWIGGFTSISAGAVVATVLNASTSTYGAITANVGLAASVATTTASAFLADVPAWNTGATATSMSGLYVRNQGRSEIGNAYGVYIMAQSGATTKNVGLYNAGTTELANDLIFSGTGRRIMGDFTNATLANRVTFQTSTTNGTTNLQAIPNGTATQSDILLFNNPDPNNAAILELAVSAGEAALSVTRTGTGAVLPLVLKTQATERMRIDTAGAITFPNNGGMTLPANCVHTATLSAGAAGWLLGQYWQPVSWTSPGINTWHETAVQLTVSCSGALVRIDFFSNVSVPSGTVANIGPGVDGAIIGTMHRYSMGTSGANMPCQGTTYYTPTAGTRRFSIMTNHNAGTLSLDGSAVSHLAVYELRR